MYCVELEEIYPFYEGAGHRNIQSLPVPRYASFETHVRA